MNTLHIRFQSAKLCFLIVTLFLSVLISGGNAMAQAAPAGESIFTDSAGLRSAQTLPVNPPSAGWPMQGHDMQRTGMGSVAGPLSSKIKWTYDFMHPVWHTNVNLQDNASPIVSSDGTIYQITRSDGVYALKPDGTLKWYMSGEGGFYYGEMPHPHYLPILKFCM